jgi:hypothetical protein
MPRWKAGIHIPTLDAEKARAPKDDALHEAALPLDLAANREATGRNVRAIDAIIVFDVSERTISHLKDFLEARFKFKRPHQRASVQGAWTGISISTT